MLVGPLHLSRFVDANNQSSTIQLNAAQLLTALNTESGLDEHQGWLSRPKTFYVLVEALNVVSAEQLVFRKAAVNSNYASMLRYT